MFSKYELSGRALQIGQATFATRSPRVPVLPKLLVTGAGGGDVVTTLLLEVGGVGAMLYPALVYGVFDVVEVPVLVGLVRVMVLVVATELPGDLLMLTLPLLPPPAPPALLLMLSLLEETTATHEAKRIVFVMEIIVFLSFLCSYYRYLKFMTNVVVDVGGSCGG
jgi:hypothetical protein